MEQETDTTDIQTQLAGLQQQVAELSAEFYKGNFSASQDFGKYSVFTSRMKVPHSTSNPTVGVVGDIVEVGGKLLICTTASSTAPVWTIVGSQS